MVRSAVNAIAVIVVAVMCTADEAAAQCWMTGMGDPFEIKASECNRTEEYYHFLSSKGAYATAVSGGRIPMGNTCALNGSTNRCLKFTGSCSQTIAPTTGCAADPAYQPGEISCWCQSPASIKGAYLALGETVNFSSALQVDTDLDSLTDYAFCHGSTSTSTCGAYVYGNAALIFQLHPEYYRIEWEDMFPPGSSTAGRADYNDYVMGWEFRDCRPSPESHFPESAQTPAACVSQCGSSCDDTTLSEVNAHIRVNAGLTVDGVSPEIQLEPNGRLFQLTINAYADFMREEDGLRKYAAVCPVLNLDWRTTPGSVGDVVPVIYGMDVCNGDKNESLGVPVCLSAETSSVLAISGSVQQRGDLQYCGPWESTNEAFIFREAETCLNPTGMNSGVLPYLYSQQYEFRIDDIDANLSSGLQYGGLSTSSIIGLVDSVDVYLFWDINQGAAPFVCPSGSRIRPGDVHPSVAKMFKYTLTPGSGLTVQARR